MANLFRTPLLFLGVWLTLVMAAPAQQTPYSPSFGDGNSPFRNPDGSPQKRPGPANPELNQKMIDADKARQAGEYQRAIDLTDDILRQSPNESIAYYLRGSARVELGVRQADAKLIRDGVADARDAIRYDAQHNAMYYLPYLHGMKNLAVLENRREHAETAVGIATQILGVTGVSNDDKANLLFQRAQSEGWLGKSDAAIADFEEALRLVPVHFGARAALADILMAAGKNDQATLAFNKLVDSFPESPLSYNNRGMFLQRQGKYDEAITDFTRAVERDPNYYYAYTNRGFTFLKTDNPAAAQPDFTQSLKLNPQQAFVYNLRGLSRLALNDLPGATQDQRTAVEMSPKDAAARGDLGFLLVFADDFAGAMQEFDAAQAIDPQIRHLNPWKIVALKRLGRTDQLKEQFSDSLKKEPKQRDWIDQLTVYLLGGQTDGELLAEAGKAQGPLKNDETCEAEFFIAATKAGAGKPAEAQAAYQLAIATKSRQLSAFRGAQFALSKAGAPGASTAVSVSPNGPITTPNSVPNASAPTNAPK